MRISTNQYSINYRNKNTLKDQNPTLIRTNKLHEDLEFDIIADKIKSENLKNQMNLKLSKLKRNINDFINK